MFNKKDKELSGLEFLTKLEANDVVVLRLNKIISMEAQANIDARLRPFHAKGIQFLVLEPGTEINVLRPPPQQETEQANHPMPDLEGCPAQVGVAHKWIDVTSMADPAGFKRFLCGSCGVSKLEVCKQESDDAGDID